MLINYISIFVFISVLLLVLGLYRSAMIDEKEFSRRMAIIVRKKEKDSPQSGHNGVKEPVYVVYRGIKKIISATPLKKRVEQELVKADLPLRGEEFLVLSIVGISSTVAVVLLMSSSLLYALICLFIMLPLPYLFIIRARQLRLAKIGGQIGDALVIIANSLRSGFSFLQAMDLVRKEMPDPIAREFARAFQEINLGTPTEQALQNMVDRVGSDDLEMVVTAVLIQRQVGGNLAEVLDNIAHTIRERIRIKGEIKTLTSQGRISGLIVGLLPTALAFLLFLINPEYIILLFTTTSGLILISIALLAQTTGFLLIRKIVDIKY